MLRLFNFTTGLLFVPTVEEAAEDDGGGSVAISLDDTADARGIVAVADGVPVVALVALRYRVLRVAVEFLDRVAAEANDGRPMDGPTIGPPPTEVIWKNSKGFLIFFLRPFLAKDPDLLPPQPHNGVSM